jgi:hypothetical protein
MDFSLYPVNHATDFVQIHHGTPPLKVVGQYQFWAINGLFQVSQKPFTNVVEILYGRFSIIYI